MSSASASTGIKTTRIMYFEMHLFYTYTYVKPYMNSIQFVYRYDMMKANTW